MRHNAPEEELRRPPAGGRGSSCGETRRRLDDATFPSAVNALRRRQLVADAALAAAIFAFSLVAVSRGDRFEGSRDFDALAVVLAALVAWPLAARRVATLPVFAVSTAATAALYGLGYGLGPPVGFAIALYTLAEQRDQTPARLRRIVLAASIVALLGPHLVRGDFAPQLLLGSAIWAAAWFAGDRARLRRERLAELEERAVRAEREAERERRLAAAEERMRIARDLHDSAGHAINVILVQAGAARLLQEQDPARSRAALETIEEVARGTLGEIDQLVRALRENGAAPEVEPPPGLAAVETLAERFRASGLAVSVTTDGARRMLAPAVDQAAYRIVQEALTNASRHGNGDVDVQLTFGPQALELSVTNTAASGAVSHEDGHGIVGMRERASLLGGTLEAGARDGRFRVRAELPYEAEHR
jgi:signal transduction histidine kinase